MTSRSKPNPDAAARAFNLSDGRKLLYAGRIQPDKDLYSLLRVALRAQILFPDLQIIIASDVVDEDYLTDLLQFEPPRPMQAIDFPVAEGGGAQKCSATFRFRNS